MANGIYNPYIDQETDEFYTGRYQSAQDQYNEGGMGLDMSSQYNTGVPLINLNTSAGSRPNFYPLYAPNMVEMPTIAPGTYEGDTIYSSPSTQGFTLSDQAQESLDNYNPKTKFPNIFERLANSKFARNFTSNIATPQGMAGMASGLGGIIGGLMGRGKRRRAQIKAQKEYDEMRQQYMDLDTSNIYANVENKYLNMENVYEDLTVNKQQAEFERRMFEQQQASTMTNLRAAAGSSGIAGLAQALSNQASVQAQKAAGSIGLQESRNQALKAREASRIQFAERGGEAQAEAMRLAGAETARGLEYQKQGTLFGMAGKQLSAANQAIAASDAALYGGIGTLAGTILSAGIGTPRPTK